MVSTAKHFAVYSEPKGGRDGNRAHRPARSAARNGDAAPAPVGAGRARRRTARRNEFSYNDYDGVPISGNSDFLIERLRKQWGFRGYVVSDSDAVEFLYSKHHVAANADDAAAMFLREGGNVRTTFTPPETIHPARSP